MQQVNDKQSSGQTLREIQAGLERLERREWWRWATALLIMLLLTVGVFLLSFPGTNKDIFRPYQWNMAVPGLFAVVLVFSAFVVHQQTQISRMRRQLSSQIGMLAALEVLKPVALEDQAGWSERRRGDRHAFDQRLKVTARVDGQDSTLYGRIIDLSEHGLGAVISGSLQRGDEATLEFSMGAGRRALLLKAIIRYSRGFRHGFEFSGVKTAELEQIRTSLLELAPASPKSNLSGAEQESAVLFPRS